MANIQARRNKQGRLISYSIRVFKGRDPLSGRQLTPYTMTWTVPVGWTEKRAEKEARRQAILFEQQCRQGRVPVRQPTFAEYARYVLDTRERTGRNKPSTLYTYRRMLEVLDKPLGYLRLNAIGPQELNLLYRQLNERAAAPERMTAVFQGDFSRFLEQAGLCPHALQQRAAAAGQPVSIRSLTALSAGRPVRQEAARRIAAALGQPAEPLFQFRSAGSSSSILRYHRLISTILEQAVKELLIPDNPCRRATVPRPETHQPNFFDPETVGCIFQALEGEPIAWKTMLHLFLVTGCRRGEILGIKWDKIDWNAGRVRIDTTVLYTPDRGLYEDTPKTAGSVRSLALPQETMALLRQYRRWCAQQREYGEIQGYLFARQDGTAMNPGQVNDWMASFARRHGLPHINPHAFRHTQASILCYCGVDVVSISHRLGHTNTSTTANIYSHVLPQAEDRIAQCITDVMIRPSLCLSRQTG